MTSIAGKRIGLVTASASRQGGGVFEAVVAQAGMIREAGGVPIVFALEDDDCARDRDRFDSVSVHVFPVRGPRQIGFAPGFLPAMIAADLDCLHLHGIWMYPSRAGHLWALRTGRAYVISPHGMLDPWITLRGRWKKALARAGYERASWASATRLHALTRREAQDIARETGRGDSIVIANAGPQIAGESGGKRTPLVAYVGRIHAKKNLVALVQGWAMADRPSDARLRICGWGDARDIADLRAAIAQTDGSVQFDGPIYGQEKDALIATARFVVLPSHSEGLPMAMLEAWAAATPTIMTAECNLPEGFAGGASLDCGYDAQALAAALSRALAMTEPEWQAMSKAAQDLAAGPFSPATIAASWVQAYAGAMAGHPIP